MDPAIFESTYHGISIDDARLGLRGQVDITRYVSGWPSGGMDEFYAVLSVLARKLKLSGPNQVPAEFRLAGDSRIDPDECFYRHSLRRAYECRASPDEIRDAIRLAFFAGRFKFPVTAQAYAKTWFGTDCNAFVGNYCGISPSTSIAAYARGYPNGAMQGATPDLYTSRGLLPVPPVESLDDIKAGTILATFGAPDTRGNRWRHIALVQEFTPTIGVGGARTGGTLIIAEWGRPGGTDLHVTKPAKVQVKEFKCPELPGRPCLAFDGTDPGGNAAKRIFMDGSRFDEFSTRGFQIYNGTGSPTYNT